MKQASALKPDEIKKQNSIKISKIVILIGFSIGLTIISFKIIIKYNDIMSNLFKTFTSIEMYVLLVAFFCIIQGGYFYSKPELLKMNYKSILVFLPYFLIAATIKQYHWIYTNDSIVFYSKSIIYIYLFAFWVSIIIELNKFITSLYRIFNNSEMESKDKLTIIIAIIGTVIAAIALLK